MAGKRGRKAKEAEVVDETNSEENTAEEEVPAKKRGRAPNPKSEEKELKKKTGQSKVEKEESDMDDENEAKEEEDDTESKSDEVEAKNDDKEVEISEDEEKEADEVVEEKPKRGRGKPKKEAAKPKAKAAPMRKTQRSAKGAPKYTDENGSEEEVEELNNKAEDSDVEFEEEEAPKKKRKAATKKPVRKNGVTSSPSRSSGRNASRKVASYAEVDYDDDAEMKGGRRGRQAGRSKKDDSDSEKVDKEVRVVLEHCKSCQVYRRNALALKEAFERVFDNIDVSINPENPRRGSFECVLLKESGSSVVVWSGIDKGPPRKLKFPDHEDVISRLQKEL